MDWQAFLAGVVELLRKLFPSWFATKQVGAFPLIHLLRVLLDLWPLPASADKDGWKAWLLKAVGVLEGLAGQTPNSLDDDGVKLLKALVESPAVFDLVWNRLQSALVDNVVMQVSESDPEIVAAAEEAKIDPATIMLLIQLAVQVIQWWRSRKEG